ncbi:unnamed protein product [Strongylus vulgaris]|uniref:Uncharacterized protein n=1 Tax=Strongylus vulgaris TaxID=40348 RepID=A0A3P7JNP9_STRVU|nr:unnamed protein product [Strongylus vulgaris]
MYSKLEAHYIGEMAKDYIYAVTPLLVDAMMERDQVHRQIAIDAVAHLSLGEFLQFHDYFVLLLYIPHIL